jgi:hypothetical protein
MRVHVRGRAIIEPMGTCTFCPAEAALIPTEACRLCWRCARRIAKLALAGEARSVWDTRMPPPDPDVDEIAARVAKSVGADGDQHYTLAQAFRAMLMYRAALHEAALAFETVTDAGRATLALRMMLTDPLLRDDGLGKLRGELSEN